ncbi:hypothetical protein FRC12_008660 [Ceratobasidium sp. 428]|nr:hypothetical protein FRC12_008660 [Ceratobasidium sp. 428]
MDLKCHALDNLRAHRSALATAIQSYLVGCAELRSACSQIQHQSGIRRELEPVLLAVEAELADLASEESELRKARATLSVLRNTSSTLSPVHTLPSEILARIFLMAQSFSSRASEAKSLAPAHDFSQVSSYWRATAINLPHLWTHICIAPTQTNYEYATLLLRRSKGLPIYLDISSKKVEKWNSYPSKPKLKTFLVSVGQHVHTLKIVDLFNSPRTFPDETIQILLSHASSGIMNTLRIIKRPGAEQAESLNSLFASRSNGAVLHSITVLHLRNVLIPSTSAIYHNLVDLRLQLHYNPQNIPTSQLELAGMLAASPGLTILKLECLNIIPSEGWDEEKVVRLAHLKILYLENLCKDSCVALMQILSLSDCLGTLEVGIHQCYEDYLEEIADLSQNFLRGVRVKTLALSPDLDYHDGAQWALRFSKTIPFLENLIIDTSDLRDVRGSGGKIDKPGIDISVTSRLPNLFLMADELDLEKLKLIVSVYGVETLHLDKSRLSYGSNRGPSRGELKTALLESFPSLECTVSDKDTTRHWPCRRMFDW